MSTPLVSILSPCYNGESYIARFLDSVLRQTYSNLELILIDDGSTDRTGEIVAGYYAKFAARNIPFLYLRQPNGGQAAALNKALKLFRGDYITWPDSDDIMDDDCIAEKAGFLEAHPECGMVYCKCRMLSEEDLKTQVGLLERKVVDPAHDNVFEDLLLERNIYFAPVGTMARASYWLDTVPSRTIYESPRGQNWQMMLPLSYQYPTGYIDRELATYLYRLNSHSRSVTNVMDKYDRQEILINNVLDTMLISDAERARYRAMVKAKYDAKRANPDYTPDHLGLFPEFIKE